METLEMRRFCIANEDGFYLIRKKEFILRHSNGLFYDYYVHRPYRDTVDVIRILQELENPDLDANESFFEISEGFLLNMSHFESYTIKGHTVQTRLDYMTDILPKLILARGRVRAFREALSW